MEAMPQDKAIESDSRLLEVTAKASETADALHSNLTHLEARLAKVIRKTEPHDDLNEKLAEVTMDSEVVSRIDGIAYSINKASRRVVALLENLDV
jgi:hypothetical protein